MRTLEVLSRIEKGKRIKPSTLKNYKRAIGSLAKYSEEWPDEAHVINEWLNGLGHLGDETVRLYFRVGKAASKFIQKAGGRNPDRSFKIADPFEDAEIPKVEHKERVYWQRSQLQDITRACKSEEEVCLLGTLMASTCRIGELSDIRGRDIKDGYFICNEGKTGERRYRLSIELAQRLRQLAGSPDDYVFKKFGGDHKANGGRVTSGGLSARVKRVVVRAHISGKKLGAHTIRHSMGTLIAEATGSELVVAAILGNTPDVARKYIHEVDRKLQQTVDTLGLAGSDVFAEVVEVNQKPRLALTDGSQVVDSDERNMVVIEQDLTADLFPAVGDGVSIRPLLKADDIRLIKEVMVEYARVNKGSKKMYDCQALLKRMLRKVR